MFLQDFFESVDDDVNASIKARSAALDIAKVLYTNEFDFEIDDAGEEFLAVSGKHAGQGFEDVLFVFGNRKPGISGPSGGFGVLNPPVEGHNFVVVIYSGSPLQENQPKDYMSLNVIRIMSHELIHYFDYRRSNGKITKSYAGSDDREAYFNDPAEFNAFFNDLTAHISDFIYDSRKDPNFAKDLAELYGVDRSFEATLNNMISRSDRVTKAFVKNLNEPRRKALLKRLYRLHQEAVKLLPVSESVLNEGPHDDLLAAEKAQIARDVFVGWLSRHNENKPISAIMQRVGIQGMGPVFVVSAREVGIDEADDLSIGFFSGEEKTRGLHLWFGDHSFVLLNLDENPQDMVDVVWRIDTSMWSTFVHEMTHYFDTKRGYSKHALAVLKRGKTKSGQSPHDYINDPAEFNAHFQQGVEAILDHLTRIANRGDEEVERYRIHLQSFEKFKANHKFDFPEKLLHFMNSTYRRKFERRLFKLYDLIRSDWPNIDAVMRAMARWQAQADSFD